MLFSRTRLLIGFFAFLTLATCVDPYYPVLKSYAPMLVVDGLITDSKSNYIVRLSTSFQNRNSNPVIENATVFISDNTGEKNYLYYTGNGVYMSDSSQFRGLPGRTYVLHIVTTDGKEYASDSCLMQAAADIDKVYYEKDEELYNNGTESDKGLRIYVDSKSGGQSHYYRWGYEETWRFRIPYPKRFEYINSNTIQPVARVHEYCWRTVKSAGTSVHPVNGGQDARIERQPVLFIASARSDRLMLEYSVLVNQYSISEKEFEFWSNIKTVEESGGDIFGSQPYSVISNIHNVNDPHEKVLGYFQVSAVKQKRIFIPFSVVIDQGLPFYREDKCARIEAERVVFYGGALGSFDDLYNEFNYNGYTFIEPLYSASGLDKLVFTTPECADCEVLGTSNRPDFWIDLK